MLLTRETFGREWRGSVFGHEDEALRGVGRGGRSEAGRRWPGGVGFRSLQADSGREQAQRAAQVERKAGKDGGYVVAGGVEVGHAREAVAALDRAEHFLDGAADQRESMVVLDLSGAKRLALARSTHQP